MKFKCRLQCHKLEGYEKGYYHYTIEGKRWCSNCDYKIDTNARSCPCCKGTYRVVPKKNKSRRMLLERREKERLIDNNNKIMNEANEIIIIRISKPF